MKMTVFQQHKKSGHFQILAVYAVGDVLTKVIAVKVLTVSLLTPASKNASITFN